MAKGYVAKPFERRYAKAMKSIQIGVEFSTKSLMENMSDKVYAVDEISLSRRLGRDSNVQLARIESGKGFKNKFWKKVREADG